MKDIILKPRNLKESKLVSDLLNQLGIPFASIDDDIIQDEFLLKEMKKAKKGDLGTREEVMQILKRK
ncbi:MAG: hypothetical protein V4622_05665 [Bacteroidota bacterium]